MSPDRSKLVTALGAFTFVLHSHLPYARLAGRWPHGEEWIHEAASETYVPLLSTLYDLKEEGIHFKLTIGITPILGEQLADDTVLFNFVEYLDAKIKAAKSDVELYADADEGEAPSAVDADGNLTENAKHLHYLASWYQDFYQGIKDAFIN
ncbi:MAG: hypothetical protein KC708_09950, partial [Anaerolineae bacterium]|nr:hypothetical protein [Anaerolineae bacterium]